MPNFKKLHFIPMFQVVSSSSGRIIDFNSSYWRPVSKNKRIGVLVGVLVYCKWFLLEINWNEIQMLYYFLRYFLFLNYRQICSCFIFTFHFESIERIIPILFLIGINYRTNRLFRKTPFKIITQFLTLLLSKIWIGKGEKGSAMVKTRLQKSNFESFKSLFFLLQQKFNE